MFLLRRTALRALSSAPRTFSSPSRTFITQSPSTLRLARNPAPFALQRRFASDETDPAESKTDEATPSSSESGESSSVSDVISSATSQATEATESAAQSLTETAGAVAAAVGIGGSGDAPRFSRTGRSRSDDGRPVRGEAGRTNGVYLGNLYFSVTEQEIRSAFDKFGTVEAVNIVYDRRGLSRGIAFVTFTSADEAGRAIAEMHGTNFEGRTLVAQYAFRASDQGDPKNFQNNPASKTLFIGNMSFSMSDKDLNDLFLEVDDCTDVRIAMDRRTGLPRGFAHADFTNVASAEKAREHLNNREVLGRKLRIDFGRSPAQRRGADRPQIDPSAEEVQ